MRPIVPPARRRHVIAALLVGTGLFGAAIAQPSAPTQADQIRERVQRDGRAELSGIVIERFDFDEDGGHVEAMVVRPIADGRRPGLLLIPGHSRTAYDMLPQAVRFARAGFATIAVSQPGYGGSTGPADFVGPKTFAALRIAAERFARQPYVDAARMGVYGYSRGALAAAELATRTDLFKASVFGGGIYDFRAAYNQTRLPGIRANMEAEAGMSDEAVRLRSPINDVAGLDGPVLIIHGDADDNAPLEQARALAARLDAAHREYQLSIVPGGAHALSMQDVVVPAIQFFTRVLGGN